MERTPLHYLGFVYVGFAELTDNIFSDEEHAKVVELISDCDARGDIPQEDLAIIIAEIMIEYESITDRAEREKIFVNDLDYLNKQDWFDKAYKEKYVSKLFQLMLADGIRKPSEAEWMRKIGKLWGVEEKVEELLA